MKLLGGSAACGRVRSKPTRKFFVFSSTVSCAFDVESSVFVIQVTTRGIFRVICLFVPTKRLRGWKDCIACVSDTIPSRGHLCLLTTPCRLSHRRTMCGSISKNLPANVPMTTLASFRSQKVRIDFFGNDSLQGCSNFHLFF